MKTLKKVLSVALVLVMALSLMTVVGAAGKVSKYQDFTDAADIENKEAVDTLVGLGIINGMDDGSYSPEGYFTRAQAAKIMAYMLLGENVAAALKASSAPFADVPAAHWAAPFIQYCVSRGILNGVGDNKYDPDGQVTAAQFAKMLLTAAGYGKMGEYVGADWAINTIVDAQNLDILDTGVDYMAPATRDQVARYAFNFYTNVAFVVFNKNTDAYETRKTDEATPRLLTLAVQQGVSTQAAGVAGGVNMRKWVKTDKNGNVVALTGNTFTATNANVLYAYTDGTSFSSLTTYGDPLFKVALETVVGGTVKYYYNGVELTASTTPTLSTVTGNLDTGKRGVVVQLLDTNLNGYADAVVVTEKTAAVVAGEPYITKAGKIIISGVIASGDNVDAKNVVGYEGLKVGDVVLYYKDLVSNVYYLEKAKSVTGQLTSARSGNQTVTFAGANYYRSGLALLTYTQLTAIGNFNADATIWVDDDNSIVYFAKALTAPAPTNVALLTGYTYDSFYGTAAAKIVKDDGTTATYAVAATVLGVPDQRTAFKGVYDWESGDPTAYFVSYSINDEGKISLTKITDKVEVASAGYTGGNAQIVLNDGSGDATYYMTANTKVFYFDTANPVGYDYPDPSTKADNNIRVTTGYAKTANADGGTDVYYVLAENTTNVVSAILFCDSLELSVAPSYKYVYVTTASVPEMSIVNNTPVYTYTVYVNGKKDTVKATVNNLFSAGEGLYAVKDVNGFASVESTELVEEFEKEIEFVDANYIVVDGDDVIELTANTKFYRYDALNTDEQVYEATIGALSPFVTYTVTDVLWDNNDKAVAVYFTFEVL